MPRQVRVLLVVTVTDYGYADDEPRDEFKPANDRDLGRLVAEQIWDDIKHGAVPVRGGVTFEPLEGCSQCHGTGILLNQSYSGAPWAPRCIPVQACDECSVHPSDVAAVTALVEANRKMRRLLTGRNDMPDQLLIGWNGWYGPEGEVIDFPDGDVWVTTDRENAGPMEPEGMEP